MIVIVDYGVGNIKAFTNIYKRLNIPFSVARNANDLLGAKKLILPGVGAFDYAMDQLNDSGMKEQLEILVLQDKVPIVGICVGMQMLAKGSDEGIKPGLGWIDGWVKRFDESKINYSTHLPHMGWNDITNNKSNPLLEGLGESAKFYFLHSYYFECHQSEDEIATTEYGIQFSSAINKSNIYGVQFHPEKSHFNGTKLLENFAKLVC